jgi:hypothetical protein
MIRLTEYLVADADKDYLNPESILKAITSWGIKPRRYIHSCDSKTIRVLLEAPLDLTANDYVPVIAKLLENTKTLNTEAIISNLRRVSEQPEFPDVLANIETVGRRKELLQEIIRAFKPDEESECLEAS